MGLFWDKGICNKGVLLKEIEFLINNNIRVE